MKKIILFLVLTLNLHIFLYAQNDTSIFDLSLEQLMNIKISSVSKAEEAILKAPQTVIVITDEEIARRGYTDLEQIFHDLPGFDISRGYGTQYSQIYQRGYRSNNTERTLFLIDGVEQNDLWSNSVWLSRQYPLSNIKRIEIIYGPASTLYGANAFVGVVNIITKNPAEITKNKKLGISAQVGYGTWNTKYADISFAANSKNIGFTSTLRLFSSNNMDISKYPDWDYDLSGYDINFYKQKLNTQNVKIAQTALLLDRQAYYHDTVLHGIPPQYSNMSKDYLFSAKIKTKDFTFGINTFERNEGYGAWYRDDYELGPLNNAKWVPKNTFIFARYKKQITPKIIFTSFSRYKHHKLSNQCQELYFKGFFNSQLSLNDLVDSAGNILPDSLQTKPHWLDEYFVTNSSQYRIENSFTYKSKHFLEIAGIDARQSIIQGEYIHGKEAFPEETAYAPRIKGGDFFNVLDFGLYVQSQYIPSKKWKFVAGGRLDYNRIRVHQGYGTIFTPKVAIIYSPQNFFIKAIYSKAFQDASFWTKYGTTPGRLLNNPYLKPEKVENLELSLLWKINKNMYLDIDTYHSNYHNTIGTVEVSFVNENGDTITTTQHQSIGSLFISGIQTNFNAKFKHLSIYANYTFTAPYSIYKNKKTRIGDIASHKANLILNFICAKHLNINIRANYVGLRPTGKNTTVANNPLNKINPYLIFSSAISYSLRNKITLQLAVNNIFDKEYFDPGVRSADGNYYAAEMPQYTRNFMAKILLNF